MSRIRLIAAFLCLATSLEAQQIVTETRTDTTTVLNFSPVIDLVPTQGSIVIDGQVDDPGWATASVATDFSESFPDPLAKPPIGIQVKLTYDDKNLYILYVIEDDPDLIRSSMRNRDDIWEDDYVGVMLDTYADNAWAYFLAANPLGNQGDTRLVVNGEEDLGFNVVYDSEGQITESGYQVEMRIPFENLRFPNRDIQTWKINFWITHPRESRNTYSWAALNPDEACWLCQIGTVTGIKGVESASRQIEFLPALVGSNSGARAEVRNPGSAFERESVTLDSVDPSLNIRYNINSSTSAELAINPDFSQIESDQAQIDVNTTFALFYNERRPFFQEGSDLLTGRLNTVYTRAINNPLAAAKIIGRFGKTNVAIISALDEDSPIVLPFSESSTIIDAGRSYSNIFRIKQNLANDSYVGGMISDRRYDLGGSGTNVSLDALVRLDARHLVMAQWSGSSTHEADLTTADHDPTSELIGSTFYDNRHTGNFDGESFTGFGGFLGMQRNGRHWSWNLGYQMANPTFRADNGFIQQNDRSRFYMDQGYTFYPKSPIIDRLTIGMLGGYDWNHTKERQDEFGWINVSAQLTGQTMVMVRTLLFSNERFRGIDFRNMQRVVMFAQSNFSSWLGGGFNLEYGDQIARNDLIMGTATNAGVFANYKPMSQFVIQPGVNYFRLVNQETDNELFSGFILRTRMNYQFTRAFSLRTVVQYNDFTKSLDVEPLLTYQANPFTVFYLGAVLNSRDADAQLYPGTGFYTTGQSVFFKLQYLFKT